MTWSKSACFQLLISGGWSTPWIRWVWCLQIHPFRETGEARFLLKASTSKLSVLNQTSRSRLARVGIHWLGVESGPRLDAARMEAPFEVTWENTGCRVHSNCTPAVTRHVLPVIPPHLEPRGRWMPYIDTMWQLSDGFDVYLPESRESVSVHTYPSIFCNCLIKICCNWTSGIVWLCNPSPSRAFALATFRRKASSFKTSEGQQNEFLILLMLLRILRQLGFPPRPIALGNFGEILYYDI